MGITARRTKGWARAAFATIEAILLVSGTVALADPGAEAAPRLEEQPPAATTFQISSFNLLGSGHTAPGGNHPGWASGVTRMNWAVQLLNEGGVDLVGFQEMESPQYKKFMELEGSNFAIFPGNRIGNLPMANSIAWRLDTWALVRASTIEVPYFHGNMIRKPVVLLQNVHTGQQAYFFNTHNPASTRGPAQEWRNKAVAIEVALANRLREASPDIPVFFTGDMNDREKFFCPVTAGSELLAANGGTNSDGVCTPPVPTKIDWIMGTPEVAFTAYTARDDKLVNKTTDHPVILATANIPPAAVEQSEINRVLVLEVEGLRSGAVRRAGEEGAPNLFRLMGEGASTLNARTEVERTTLLPNVVGMLTGRRVTAAQGGHGISTNNDNGGTVESAAGRYTSSVYDLVHNFGLSTALLSSNPKTALVARSWDSSHGGADPYGLDNGTAKISRSIQTADDHQLVERLVGMLTHSPKTFTLAQISLLADSGRRDGWMRPEYFTTLTEVDSMIGQVLDSIDSDPALKDHALVLLTASGGGRGHDNQDASHRANFTIPFIAWGPGVVAGADLYAINPAYIDPGTAQVGYHGVQPIRNGDVANLVTAVLGLPALPGSILNAEQDLNILVGPEVSDPPA